MTAKQVEARVLPPHLFQTRKLCPKRLKRDEKKNMQVVGKAGDGGTEAEGAGGAGGGEQHHLLRFMRTCVHLVEKGELRERCV